MQITRVLAGLILFSFASFADIPDVYVDPGACPGEGCGYCALFRALTEITVYERASAESKQLGQIPRDDTFIAKTGEVHTVPTRFEVHREHDGIMPGDDVLALTYLGEGYFRIFHNGKLTQADLKFSPWGGTPGNTCDKPKYCWGRLTKELEFTWWMYIIAESNLEGWVIADESMREIQNKW